MQNTEKPIAYELIDMSPVTYTLPSRDSRRSPLLYYDEKEKENRALRYAPNQKSPFLDEQDHHARLEHIIFREGDLIVEPRNKVLIEFLRLHPGNEENGGRIFRKIDNEKRAKAELDYLDAEDKARELSKELNAKEAERIMRVINPNAGNISSVEIKRDVRIYARNNPIKFLEMIEDSSSALESLILEAIEEKVITLNGNNTEVSIHLPGEKKRKLLSMPEGTDHIGEIEKHLIKDVEVFKKLERALKIS